MFFGGGYLGLRFVPENMSLAEVCWEPRERRSKDGVATGSLGSCVVGSLESPVYRSAAFFGGS